jgi:hypothetical protein
MLPELVPGYELEGEENILPSGPLIVAANHPGTFDALVAAACLPRDDFKTIARGMPFLRSLPAIRLHLIFSTRDVGVKMAAARAAVQHLESGGVLLIFPAGDLEPDPACLPGAIDSLSKWSASLELLLRKVPETKLQVAILSRLIAPGSLNHPLARMQKDPHRRQIVAEIMQVTQQMVFSQKSTLRPRISFGKPFSAEQLRAAGAGSMMPAILRQAQDLLARHTPEVK